jgi:DNA-binding transcriptional MerR regulator
MPDDLLSIGELAAQTGVAVTALRFYDELGLVRPARRDSGRRRYDAEAVRAVGAVLFLREVGFSLAEVAELMSRPPGTDGWPDLIDRKLAEIAEQEHRLAVARNALEHARECPAGDPTRCPRFWAIIDARLAGTPLASGHAAG